MAVVGVAHVSPVVGVPAGVPAAVAIAVVEGVVSFEARRQVAEQVLGHVGTGLAVGARRRRLPTAPAVPVGGAVRVTRAAGTRIGCHSPAAVVGVLATVEKGVLGGWK